MPQLHHNSMVFFFIQNLPMGLGNPDVQGVAEGEGVVLCLHGGFESQRRLGDLVGHLGCEVVEVAGRLHLDLGGVAFF